MLVRRGGANREGELFKGRVNRGNMVDFSRFCNTSLGLVRFDSAFKHPFQ